MCTYIYLWFHLHRMRNYNGFAKTTNLLHTSQSVYSMWLRKMCKPSIWEKRFSGTETNNESTIKESTEKSDKYHKTLNSSFNDSTFSFTVCIAILYQSCTDVSTQDYGIQYVIILYIQCIHVYMLFISICLQLHSLLDVPMIGYCSHSETEDVPTLLK